MLKGDQSRPHEDTTGTETQTAGRDKEADQSGPTWLHIHVIYSISRITLSWTTLMHGRLQTSMTNATHRDNNLGTDETKINEIMG